jgi:hypothetical protein
MDRERREWWSTGCRPARTGSFAVGRHAKRRGRRDISNGRDHAYASAAPTVSAPSAGATVPLKLCPHCQAQSATASTDCPNCGKRYVKKKTWPWVLGAVFLLMVIGFAGCVALVGTVASKAVDALNAEQARHAITPGQFAAVQLGTSRSGVVSELGKPPENAQDFVQRGFLNGQPTNSSCIYYNKAGGSFGNIYQFCFQNDALDSKNAY